MNVDERLYVRLEKRLKQKAQQNASKQGLRLSSYIRYLIILGDAMHIEKRKP